MQVEMEARRFASGGGTRMRATFRRTPARAPHAICVIVSKRHHEARRRRVRQQLAAGIDQPAFRGRHPATGGENGAFGPHLAGRVRDRPHEADLELERRIARALRQGRLHRAAHAAIEQRRRVAAMHAADRIVVIERRRTLEHRPPVLDLDQIETQQSRDRRRRQPPVQHRRQELEPAHGAQRVERRRAIGARTPGLVRLATPNLAHASSFTALWRPARAKSSGSTVVYLISSIANADDTLAMSTSLIRRL